MGNKTINNIKLMDRGKQKTDTIEAQIEEKIPVWKKFDYEYTGYDLSNFYSTGLEIQGSFFSDTPRTEPWVRKFNEDKIDEKTLDIKGISDLSLEEVLEIGNQSKIFNLRLLERVLGNNDDEIKGHRVLFLQDPLLKIPLKDYDYFKKLSLKIRKLIGYNKPKDFDDEDYRNERFIKIQSDNPELKDRYLFNINWQGPDDASYDSGKKKYTLRGFDLRIYDKKYDTNICSITLDFNKGYTSSSLNLRNKESTSSFADGPGFRQITPLGAALMAGILHQLNEKLK